MNQWSVINQQTIEDYEELTDIEQDLEETLIGTTRGKKPTIHNEMSNKIR